MATGEGVFGWAIVCGTTTEGVEVGGERECHFVLSSAMTMRWSVTSSGMTTLQSSMSVIKSQDVRIMSSMRGPRRVGELPRHVHAEARVLWKSRLRK